jgi:hypothetical protein
VEGDGFLHTPFCSTCMLFTYFIYGTVAKTAVYCASGTFCFCKRLDHISFTAVVIRAVAIFGFGNLFDLTFILRNINEI